jgi:hypothetical protein
VGIIEVRTALEDVLQGVGGIRSASGWPGQNLGPAPACFIDFDDDVIVQGASELDLHQLPVYVFVQQTGGNLKNELIATENVITAMRDALRGSTLGGVADHVRVLRVQEAIYEYASQPHVGFVMSIEVKERRNVGA